MKRSKSTIWNWLKSCVNAGLCDYVAILKRSVICIETNEFF